MSKVGLDGATKRLPELVDQAARGEEVVITRDDGASFKLVPDVFLLVRYSEVIRIAFLDARTDS